MPDLSISNLRVESPRGRPLIAVEQLELASGTSLAIRGPSGAGKSTLLYAVAGLIPVKTGTVSWGDQDIALMSDAARTAFRGANCGIVFQDHMLFEELSALENAQVASLYAPRAGRSSIRVSAQSKLEELGLGIRDTRSVESYSGGERQRIAVARALAAEPPILLADEPTASLDRATADTLIDDLFASARRDGLTMIVVSHDQNLIDAADRVVTVEDGRLI